MATTNRVWCGIAMPWGITIPSVIESKEDSWVLRTSAVSILCTTPGERVMLPTFGVNLVGVLQEPNDSVTLSSLTSQIATAFRTWDNRIVLAGVTGKRTGRSLEVTVSIYDRNDFSKTIYGVSFQVTPDGIQGVSI